MVVDWREMVFQNKRLGQGQKEKEQNEEKKQK